MRTKNTFRYDIREYQLRSVVLLETIHSVCAKYGLTYYIIAGTLLGALRHKGFIPWDDDIDIALMRRDYDILMRHSDEWIPEPFRIVQHETTPEYPKYFAKLEDTSTTIVENIYLGYAGGIYMDIFPLDDVPDCKFLRRIHYYKVSVLKNILYFLYRDPYKHGKGLNSLFTLTVQSIFDKDRIHSKIEKVLQEYNGHRKCGYVMTHDDGTRAFSKSVFREPVPIMFEGICANSPTVPEGFLSVLYGNDYMKLPPEEKRVSHFHDYCDLNTPYSQFNINEFLKTRKK